MLSEDVSAARRAARSLESATARLSEHFGATVDVHRLQTDVARIAQDLDLLCGKAQAADAPQPPVREVIADTSYTHSFWMDAEDEGLGRSGRQ